MTNYVGGRVTSRRRHSGPRMVFYDGRGVINPAHAEQPVLAVEPGTEGAILCPHCGTWVMKTATGLPKVHAPGGYVVAHSKGRLRCTKVVENDGSSLPVFNAEQAAKKHLVTRAQVSHALHADQNMVCTWFETKGFPKPVAMIYHEASRRFRELFQASEVMEHELVKTFLNSRLPKTD